MKLHINSFQALQIIATVDAREQPWELRAAEALANSPLAIPFDVYSDGAPTGHSLSLRRDGTWELFTEVELNV